MFIGGLNWDTTDGRYIVFFVTRRCCNAKVTFNIDSLRDYFTQFGKVDACTIMRDAAGRSRCFAFLTFEEPASVNAVMVREHFLDGKIVSNQQFPLRSSFQRWPFRLTLKEPFPAKNTSAQQNCLSEVSPGA